MKSLFRKNLFCIADSCNLCINNKYATNEGNGPLIDLQSSKKDAKINDNNTTGKFDITDGNLNKLGWVV